MYQIDCDNSARYYLLEYLKIIAVLVGYFSKIYFRNKAVGVVYFSKVYFNVIAAFAGYI
jgi:hypothetical protein